MSADAAVRRDAAATTTNGAVASRRKARAIWLKIHLYLGLALGLIFVLVGISGALLVFDHAIDEALNPDLFEVTPAGEPASLDALVAAARPAAPEGAQLWRMLQHDAPDRPHSVDFKLPVPGEDEPRYLQILVDPYTTEVKAVRFWGDFLMSVVYEFHHGLLLDHPGEVFIGFCGLLLLVSLVSGAYLWWPRNGRWRQAFTIKREAGSGRFLFDLHRVTGAYTVVVVFVLSLTGVCLSFPTQAIGLIYLSMPTDLPPRGLKSVPTGEPMPYEALVAKATSVFPDSEFKRIYFPAEADDAVRVMLRQNGDVARTYGSTNVWLDAYSGEVLASRDPRQNKPGNTVIDWVFPLHSGQAFGLGGRLLVLAGGLLLPTLAVTGLLLWLRKQRRGRRGT